MSYFVITSEFNGQKLFLRYPKKDTFTDAMPYFKCTKKSTAESMLEDVKAFFKSDFVAAIEELTLQDLASLPTKVTVSFNSKGTGAKKRGRPAKETVDNTTSKQEQKPKKERKSRAKKSTVEEFVDEDYLFADFNEVCKKCQNACKQSHKATIVQCPQYLKVA